MIAANRIVDGRIGVLGSNEDPLDLEGVVAGKPRDLDVARVVHGEPNWTVEHIAVAITRAVDDLGDVVDHLLASTHSKRDQRQHTYPMQN
jgi:hypothetical protein